jgi:hypothetical protein
MSAAPAPIPVVHFAPRYGRAARLVDVEPIELERDGQRIVALPMPGPDRQGDALALSPEALGVARLFDGTRDLRGVQRALHEATGQLVHVERIHALAAVLFRVGLLVKGGA